MRDAVIVGAVRTPLGKRNGGLADVHPVDLSAHVLIALVQRTGLDPAVVDDVIWGCVGQVGEQTYDIARNAVLAAGRPASVPGVTVDRQCGSSQQSVHFAAAGLVAGHYDVVVAGGVESMTRVPMFASAQGTDPEGPLFEARYGAESPNQGVGAEMMAEKRGFSRTQLDEFALSSHEKAATAQDDGRLAAEIAAVPLAWLAETGADPKAVNPRGGAIALGHPLGGSGARLMTTLVHHMCESGHRYGLQTMCERGGQANATILELM